MNFVKLTDVKPGAKVLVVQHLGSGWAAVLMWRNNEDFPGDVFWEPWSTGMGRYEVQADAIDEAYIWAKADGHDIDEVLK
jgi:hypothetical protein